MAFVSPRMSLKVWNAAGDPYDHEQLADNLLKLDQHDHSQGRGTPIGGDGIREGAITSTHIYPGAIGSDAIGADSIGEDKLADQSVTNEKLHPNARVPLGTVLDWWCANPGAWELILPLGWKVCDGSIVQGEDHQIPGVEGDFTLPNLIGRVIQGADPANAYGTHSGLTPGVGATGGSNSPKNLSHVHTISHTHTFAHTHGLAVNDHAHTVNIATSAAGGHAHVYRPTASEMFGNAVIFHPDDNDMLPAGGNFPSSIGQHIVGSGFPNTSAVIRRNWTEGVGDHAHAVNGGTGGTGEHGGTTNSQSDGTTSASSAANSGATSVDISAVDTRDAYYGLLKIMKVKNA